MKILLADGEEAKEEKMQIDDEISAFEEVTEEAIRAKEERKAEEERMKRQSNSQKRMRAYGIDWEGA